MNELITFLLKQVVDLLLSPYGADAFDRVIGVIDRWAEKEISNAEKREGVLAEFEIIGLKLTESVANFALEAGVQYLKRLNK